MTTKFSIEMISPGSSLLIPRDMESDRNFKVPLIRRVQHCCNRIQRYTSKKFKTKNTDYGVLVTRIL